MFGLLDFELGTVWFLEAMKTELFGPVQNIYNFNISDVFFSKCEARS